MKPSVQKRNGVHYTPAKLARFLARQTTLQTTHPIPAAGRIRILDPACGEGELLVSLIESLPCPANQIQVVGIDQDPQAASQAWSRIGGLGVSSCEIEIGDFLNESIVESTLHSFDIVIANPPYVRTQVLGGLAVGKLARRFGLTGRIDLYQAFALAMTTALKIGGTLGLLTSNRFLTVKSGASMRKRLAEDLELKHVFDLGDTKLFGAAVLPVIITGIRKSAGSTSSIKTGFHRVYRSRNAVDREFTSPVCILDALEDPAVSGMVDCDDGKFLIERGELEIGPTAVWSLSNASTRNWLNRIRQFQVAAFGELAEVKVGIKTTADSVFIQQDWSTLSPQDRPESSLIRPLITHHDARRWTMPASTIKSVLYPYRTDSEIREPIALDDYPQAGSYLQSHRQQLSARKYLIAGGRKWYEIWVPHQPVDWAKPKIVWPDISEQPRFFLDTSGAIVNGDCYWIKLRQEVDPDWLYMMLAVANSSIATTYYDTVFHNKLYSRRRRFMTQYVKEFPLPNLNTDIGRQIIRTVKELIAQPDPTEEEEVEALVRRSFGMA